MHKEEFTILFQKALQLGASHVGKTASCDIVVEEGLADYCRDCENYGLAPGCPPHVAGPAGFRELQRTSSHSIVVRVDVPSAVLFSDERWEVMALLHELVAGVELKAVEMGYAGSKAFAGGSCRKIFCSAHNECQRLSGTAGCRNPLLARPSMSGFGINVAKLLESAGVQVKTNSTKDTPPDDASPDNIPTTEPMSWVAGLVVIVDR